MWSYCIKQVGCSAFPTSSRHDHSRWVDRGRRGGLAQLGPTVPIRRADGAERLEAPRGTGQWLGQLQMGRLQPGCCSSVTSGRPAGSRPAPVLGRALAPSAHVRRGIRARAPKHNAPTGTTRQPPRLPCWACGLAQRCFVTPSGACNRNSHARAASWTMHSRRARHVEMGVACYPAG